MGVRGGGGGVSLSDEAVEALLLNVLYELTYDRMLDSDSLSIRPLGRVDVHHGGRSSWRTFSSSLSG